MTLPELVNNLEALPPAPEVLPKLMAIMKDSDTDANDVVTLIKTDPAIVTSILRLSNSALYAPPTPVTDLSDAASMLGIREIYRIVNLVTSGEFLNGELASMEIQKGSLWQHSLAVALILDIIATDSSNFDGLPYTLGLLHDIGKLALHHGCGDSYTNIFRKVETERISVNVAETATLGFGHAEVGAKMLEGWGFPEEIYLPIRYQYEPHKAGKYKELAGALQVANWGASVIGCNDGRDAWALEMDPGVFHIDETELQQALLEGRFRLEKTLKAFEPNVN